MFILDVCAGMPDVIVNIINKIVNIIKIIAPIGIVVFGMIDFVKAVSSQKDDEISKGQKVFIKRLLTGVLTFFVIALVQLVLGIVDSNGTGEAMSCLNAILGGGGGTHYSPAKVTTSNDTPCSSRGTSTCGSDGACVLCGQTGSSMPVCVNKGACSSGNIITTSSKTTTRTTTKSVEELDKCGDITAIRQKWIVKCVNDAMHQNCGDYEICKANFKAEFNYCDNLISVGGGTDSYKIKSGYDAEIAKYEQCMGINN